MSGFNRVLILGTGQVTVQLAVLFKNRFNAHIGIVGRESIRSEQFFAALLQSKGVVSAAVQNEQHRLLEGECAIDELFHAYEAATGEWDTLVMAVTTDAYLEVLRQLDADLWKHVKCIVLISPTFGSNSLVRHYMEANHCDTEVISFSTYLGDTRWRHGKPSCDVITTGIKRKLYIGSTEASSSNVGMLCELFIQLGIQLEVMVTPIEAETRNISLYVHPPLFMNDYCLNEVFQGSPIKKYVYKLFPEGPITPSLIRDMLTGWKEMTRITESLKLKGMNLLCFMTDDNYPVRPESLSRDDIDNFLHLEPIHQEYLLYIRYASLLIDPFSEPDQDGKYFDFSAVPISQIYINKEGKWDIPRMPKEDYYRTKIIQGIAKFIAVPCPTIDRFIAAYESKLRITAKMLQGESLSDAFAIRSFEEDLKMICSEISKDMK
ncbi:opine metallophore biosynthesis dehydrogenase [Paenibacillus fonticola]|uniref:opine metallophore biosynthesis dehydrogenase n=1 Tax=Paenibacillus fonticola TaxID=379896 RepID=UPI00036A5263|nr:opine metallophore biosynthesis dehydrogenase [Paenibacillus fonticola]